VPMRIVVEVDEDDGDESGIFCTPRSQVCKLDISCDEDIQRLDTSTNVRNKVSLFIYFHNNINKNLLLHNFVISMCLGTVMIM
jgi:hypothetical protein